MGLESKNKSFQSSVEDKKLYLTFLESTITRLSNNSFLIKGWSVAGIGTLFAFLVTNDGNDLKLLTLAAVLTVLCWLHDAYYLGLERAYRRLRDDVWEQSPHEINYKMSILPNRTEKFKALFRVFLSSAFLISYLPILIITLAILFFQWGNG